MKLKCKMAGKSIRDVTGQPLACVGCKGVIIITKYNVQFEKPVSVMYPFPRVPIAEFTCPMLLADPKSSDLVEVIEK